jgi:hypothetical protein
MNTSNKGFISYHPVSPLRRWITPVIVIGLFSLVGIALYFDKEPPDGLLKFYGIFGGFGLILSLATYWIAGYTKLITSEKDITLRQIGSTLSTGWDNIERIELTRGIEGLFLRKPCTRNIPKFIRYFPFGAGLTYEQLEAYSEGRFIPLSPFMWRWKDAIGEIFCNNAPQLFDIEERDSIR